jgi:transcriptional regulator with XRE-family HTH domain
MSQKHIPEHQRLRMQEISLFIKNWRLNEGLSMREFAKLADVHVNSIYNLEHKRGININTLINCIDAMDGMTLSEFFAGMD